MVRRCNYSLSDLLRNMSQVDKASNDLFSTAVATIRQFIESFFSWIQEKTKIQIASKIRLEKGLLLHTHAKLVALVLLLLEAWCKLIDLIDFVISTVEKKILLTRNLHNILIHSILCDLSFIINHSPLLRTIRNWHNSIIFQKT